jgi:hypothetical protein
LHEKYDTLCLLGYSSDIIVDEFNFHGTLIGLLSFEAKPESGTSSPIAGRQGLSSSELSADDEFAFDKDPDRSLDFRSSSDPNMSLKNPSFLAGILNTGKVMSTFSAGGINFGNR